jgi:hypothetical protein
MNLISKTLMAALVVTALAATTGPSYAFSLSMPGVSVGSQTCVKTSLASACL